MYKIAMRNGSPVNVGQMIEVDLGSATLEPGYAFCIVDGAAKSLTIGVCPDAIASEVYDEAGNKKVVAMLLTEDMLLEVPAYVADTSNVKTGAFIGCAAYSVTDSEQSEYCQIVDTLDFKKSTDKILVRFIHNNKKPKEGD